MKRKYKHRDPLTFFENNYIPEPNSGCWLWTRGLYRSGYGSMAIKGSCKSTHRLAWEFYRGPIPDGQCVLHRCDVRSCVNPDHLFLGTVQDNNADMKAKGRERHRAPRGEQSRFAKLTEGDVLDIRRRARTGENWRIAAKEYGLSKTTVFDVRSGRTWGHI